MYGTIADSNKIVKITPTGTISYITIPSTLTASYGTIIVGPDNNLWYSSQAAGKIGKIDLSTNNITEYTVASPYGLAAGSDGNIWFTSTTSGNNRIGRITTNGTNVTYFNTGLTSNCFNQSTTISGYTIDTNPLMTSDTQGNIWFLETAANKIGKISLLGDITEYTVPTTSAGLNIGIALGPDNCIWFNESNGNKIGRLNPANGVFTEFTIPTANSFPLCVCIASNGSLWLTEQSANKIGTIKLMQ